MDVIGICVHILHLAYELHLIIDSPQVFLLGLHIFFYHFHVVLDFLDFAFQFNYFFIELDS